jgi:L,D-transpeptidase catalytic domain
VGRLGLYTPDETNELVELIAERRVGHLDWIDVRTSLRPSGTIGWVPRGALSEFHRVDTWLVVDKRSLRASLIRNGVVIFSVPVGIGKPSTPTPDGTFYVRDRLSGFGSGSIYGPLAFGTSARSPVLTDWPGGAVVGIHGTNEPDLIPGRVSHGCVRMRNADVLRLGKLMKVGTPVTIR